MSKRKLKIGVLFGGKSAEHEVSVASAENVISNLNKEKYQVFPLKIEKNGVFDFNKLKKFDAVIPMLHGPYGEDGSMQGLLKILYIPYVGADILGSAVSMDKEVMKKLLTSAKVPVGEYLIFRKWDKVSFLEAKKKLGTPMFIKPANLGSSVGISKVRNEKEFKKGIRKAFEYDNKIIIEKFIKGDEIFCSVLGNEEPIVSVPGRLGTDHDFYDYDAKYVDEINMEIPARVSRKKEKELMDMAKKAYQSLYCSGMARVDMFLTKKGKIYICEINTIPGFTSHSWYPKLFEASGISTSKLLDKLIELGIERFKKEKKLKTVL